MKYLLYAVAGLMCGLSSLLGATYTWLTITRDPGFWWVAAVGWFGVAAWVWCIRDLRDFRSEI